ncbi:hypothetical protein FQN50_000151 [Emmonsiellopsis sp. PD_5]|nr:hypothetical protein FQN50_000151 [Emmonsiellopsis sp. PD_5]
MHLPITLTTLLLFLGLLSATSDAFSLYADGKTIVRNARRQIFPCQKISLQKGDNISFYNAKVDLADGCHLTLYSDSKCKKLNGYSYGDWKHKLGQSVKSWSYTC